MKKFLARTGAGGADCTQRSFDDIQKAVAWIGDCQNTTGVIFRESTNRMLYKIERGSITVDARMKRER